MIYARPPYIETAYDVIIMNVRILCLGVLTMGEASGYEIKKEIEEGLFSHFIDASFGSIYPALTQLLAEGLLTVRSEEQTGRPDKKVYAINDKGRRTLSQAISVVPAKDKYKSEFLFQMLLRDFVALEVLLAAIDKQLADLREELGHIGECEGQPSPSSGAVFVAGYGEAVLTAAVNYLSEKRLEIIAELSTQAAE
jgi:PadR family transcriptional regulator AphA